MKLVLASSSVYRKQLLQRLQIDFVTASPDIDESRLENEAILDFVKRLSIEKSKALREKFPQSLIIGSDQVIVTEDNKIQGKPHTHEKAVEQLRQVSGTEVKLITGLALFNNKEDRIQYSAVTFRIGYRTLTSSQIESYLRAEQPYDCAGSLKSEGLGTSLLTYLRGDDPTAIIGLPLIKLTDMLQAEGIEIPAKL